MDTNALLNTIVQTAGPTIIQSIGGKVGLSESHTNLAVQHLLPVITSALAKNSQSSEGKASLVGALEKGSHKTYIEQPQAISNDEAIDDGNRILGHVLGSKDVSRQHARDVAEKTGLSEDALKKALPMIAAMAMGGLSKKQEEAKESDDFASQLGGLLTQNSDEIGGLLSGLFK